MTETECSARCGYVSSGLDLWLHEAYEHAICPECGGKPGVGWAVTHEADCPRLRPDYVYPGPMPAEFEDEASES